MRWLLLTNRVLLIRFAKDLERKKEAVMKKIAGFIAGFVLVAFVAGCGPSQEEYDAKLKEIDDLKAQMEDLKAKYEDMLDELKGENEEMKGKLDELTQAKVDLEDLVKQLNKQQEQAKKRLEMFTNMLAKFKSLIEAGKLSVKIRNGKMVLELPSAVLFPSGSADLSEDGQATLSEVAPVLASFTDREFQVVGHTDTVPIKTKKFPSNWELSTARAVAVVKFLQAQGVAPTNLSAGGYSEYQPVADNESEEGKAANRRIEIVVMPNLEELPDLGDLEKLLSE
jgi:chemotaxis protein MotB